MPEIIDLRCDVGLTDVDDKDTDKRCKNPGVAYWVATDPLGAGVDLPIHLCGAHFDLLKTKKRAGERWNFSRLGPDRRREYAALISEPGHEGGTF